MVGKWNGLHGMDPWAKKEKVIWEVYIKDMAHGVLHNGANLNRKTNDSFRVPFCIIITFDGDGLIIQVSMGIPYLFYEL